jgi:hypothetical protein
MSNPRLQELAELHSAAVHAYKTTGYIDSTQDLYQDLYEYYADLMSPRTRSNMERQFDYITARILEL